jgi:hypothetical protein
MSSTEVLARPVSLLLVLLVPCCGLQAREEATVKAKESQKAPAKAGQLIVTGNFDAGLCPEYEIDGSTITFDMTGRTNHLNVLIRNAPVGLTVRLKLKPKVGRWKMIKGQGVIVSRNGRDYSAVSMAEKEGIFSKRFEKPGDLWIASTFPYGRNALERLYCDTRCAADLRIYILERDRRTVPVFEFGKDDGKKTLHMLIAGECAWETPSSWVADYMIRRLCRDRKLAGKLTRNAVLRIVPHISPYSSTMPHASYTMLHGKPVYGAATWGKKDPPIEYALMRDEVEQAIAARRLGCLLTIHSWLGGYRNTTMETIQTAGKYRVTGKRLEWAKATLKSFMRGVPKGNWTLPRKIWRAGLAREYLLKKHHAITFRIEVTTVGANMTTFEKTADRLVENMAAIEDWRPVLPRASTRKR